MEIEETLTDTQRYSNYCNLVETIKFIEQGGRITEDWIEHHKGVLIQYRAAFPSSFLIMNSEIKDKEFRKIAQEADVLINSLMTSVYYEKTFKVGQYHMLLKRMFRMLEIVNENCDDGDELATFMQNMSLG